MPDAIASIPVGALGNVPGFGSRDRLWDRLHRAGSWRPRWYGVPSMSRSRPKNRSLLGSRAPSFWMLAALLALDTVPAHAQDVGALLGAAPVQAAREAMRGAEPQTLDTQVVICETPAPPFAEGPRGELLARLFRDAGLQRVRIDAVGNVLGERPGRRRHPHVVVSAHLDTVFPAGTDVTVRRVGTELRGPGIADDCRGLAVLVALARTLTSQAVETAGSLTFVATVGEEGLGDLRGVRHLFAGELAEGVDHFVSLDGAGLGITATAVGSRRYRVSYAGPGGHSYGDFGVANPVHAAGRAIALVADFVTPRRPRTTFSVGRVVGGTSINAIAEEAWFEVDLRSVEAAALDALVERFLAAVAAAEREENARWEGRGAIRSTVTLVGDRPAGRMPDSAPIVRWAVAITRALGLAVRPSAGSTDANVPMSLGIPAVTLGAGGNGRGEHSLSEVFETTGSSKGSERILLLTLALSWLPD